MRLAPLPPTPSPVITLAPAPPPPPPVQPQQALGPPPPVPVFDWQARQQLAQQQAEQQQAEQQQAEQQQRFAQQQAELERLLAACRQEVEEAAQHQRQQLLLLQQREQAAAAATQQQQPSLSPPTQLAQHQQHQQQQVAEEDLPLAPSDVDLLMLLEGLPGGASAHAVVNAGTLGSPSCHSAAHRTFWQQRSASGPSALPSRRYSVPTSSSLGPCSTALGSPPLPPSEQQQQLPGAAAKVMPEVQAGVSIDPRMWDDLLESSGGGCSGRCGWNVPGRMRRAHAVRVWLRVRQRRRHGPWVRAGWCPQPCRAPCLRPLPPARAFSHCALSPRISRTLHRLVLPSLCAVLHQLLSGSL